MINYKKIKEDNLLEFKRVYYDYKQENINDDYIINHVYNQTFIALDHEKVIGFVIFALIYDRCELVDLYVDKNYRRMGIAKELMEIMFENSKDCNNISLEVRKDNIDAYKLYSKFGFKRVATREKYYNGMDGYLMIKEVNKQ